MLRNAFATAAKTCLTKLQIFLHAALYIRIPLAGSARPVCPTIIPFTLNAIIFGPFRQILRGSSFGIVFNANILQLWGWHVCPDKGHLFYLIFTHLPPFQWSRTSCTFAPYERITAPMPFSSTHPNRPDGNVALKALILKTFCISV